MGIRCLLGHDFSEPEIEREREEDGEEVVTTVREVKTCARCGETQVVSENTEVTTMEQLTDQATATGASSTEPTGSADGSDDAVASAEPSLDADVSDRGPDIDYGGTVGGDFADVDGDDAEILDGTPPTAGAGSGGEEPGGADPVSADPERPDPTDEGAVDADGPTSAADDEGAELIDGGSDTTDAADVHEAVDAADASAADREPADEDADGDAAADDGVILDDDGDAASDADRHRGEWPTVEAADDDATFEAAPWPEQRGEDEGFNAEIDGDDDGVEFGGLTPEAGDVTGTAGSAVESPDAEYVEPADRSSSSGSPVTGVGGATGDSDDGSAGPGSGFTREDASALETTDSQQTPTEYYCPECGMTADSGGSSMRAGDICPECKRGYVAERPR
ncbi:hypothetical protein DQW50_15495 [Halorubrum sp. 48-1-W]|uniref:DUF7093 family protein n=1 Tax=Halorubrum sp. 48-1-W TaxID=2249761 RepID=UPI000DCB7DA7|nr:hypothetical protein [Halorubrum sp. 48-1-W]RAW44239.1 hypothetical protein DQW50_15495 [Halorubrum sp. 48-1-W]